MFVRALSTPLSCLALTVLCLLPGQGWAAPSLAASPAKTLTPHKALYEVQLTSTKSGSQMIDISGKMYFEWKPTCEGWITNHRFSLDYDYADSPSINISSDFSTVESYDGKKLDFYSRRRRNGETYEELRGNAILKDGEGKAVYSLPEGLSFALDKGTLFPTAHTMALVENGSKGNKFFSVRIFDGSDDEGPVYINSFIGSAVGKSSTLTVRPNTSKSSGFKSASTNSIDNTLVEVPGWNVRMAFFPINAPESSSDYELSMVLHENGIISDMVIEYSDFSVRQKLVALEKVAPETCKN